MRDLEVMVDWLVERVAALLEVEPAAVEPGVPFSELGLTSIQALELSDDVQRLAGLALSPTLTYDHPTIEAVAACVAEELEQRGRGLADLEGAAR